MSITALIRPPWRRALTRIMPFNNPILSAPTPYADPHQPWKLLHTGRRRTPSLGTRWGSMFGLPTRCCCMDQHDGVLRRADGNSSKPLPLMLFPQLFQDREAVVRDSEAATRPANGHTRPLDFLHRLGPRKLVVAVDVDEVLGSFLSALNKFIADRYSLNHSLPEYYVYEFFKIWNCSRAEADIRVHEFFKSSHFKTGIHPIPGARRTLHKISAFCKLSVVTSRQNVIKDHTLDWIEQHYPGLFWEIHFGNHFALDGQSRPKSEICSYSLEKQLFYRSKIRDYSLCLDKIRGNCRPALTKAKEAAPLTGQDLRLSSLHPNKIEVLVSAVRTRSEVIESSWI